jgi:hypothetical protein
VNEAALVGVQRTDALFDARCLRLLGEKLRHLTQFVVFAAPEVHAVDEQPLVAELFAECAVDDVLQRLQPFAAAREQRFGAVAAEIDARAIGVVSTCASRLRPISLTTFATKSPPALVRS